jgi:hypothetical protein
MNPADSVPIFRERVALAGLAMDRLTAAEALAQLLSFYREMRADKCVLDAEGDMLLFAWGPRDAAEGEVFQLEFTRQFIQPGDEDEDGMSQIWTRLLFKMTPDLQKIGEGEHWCECPDGADAFEEFVLASDAYRAVVELTPARVDLDWSLV